MWLGHDMSWWSLVLAVLALVLTVPLGILANWVTPTLQQWWAERSISAMAKRLVELRDRLEHLNSRYPLLTEFEECIVEAAIGLGVIGVAGLQLGLFIALLPLPSRHHLSLDAGWMIKWAIVGAMFLPIWFGVQAWGPLGRLQKLRLGRGIRARRRMAASIERLEKKIAQRTGRHGRGPGRADGSD